MSLHIFGVCFLLVIQNAFAHPTNGLGQVGISNNNLASGVLSGSVGSSIGSSVSGIGSSVSASSSGLSPGISNLASAFANSVGNSGSVSKLSGNSVYNNIGTGGTTSVAVGNFGGNTVASNLAVNNIGTTGVAVGNFGGKSALNNIGTSSVSLGSAPVPGISNFKVTDFKLANDKANNFGYSGEYPVIGFVTFEGYVPATGTVSVANDADGCGCTS